MAENKIVNGNFEGVEKDTGILVWSHGIEMPVIGGWHSYRPRIGGDPPGVQEVKVPAGGWWITRADKTVPNPYWDGQEYNRFVTPPEFDCVNRSQIPEHEQDDYFRDGDWCLKPYGKAWMGGYHQKVTLPAGEGVFTVPLFADLVSRYENHQKVWAPDLFSGNIRFVLNGAHSVWIQLPAGRRHAPSFSFSHAGGEVTIGFHLLCPFALENSGFFIDGVTLIWTEDGTTDQRHFDRIVHKAPSDMTEEEAQELLDYVQVNESTWSFSADEVLTNAIAYQSREIHFWGDLPRHGFRNKTHVVEWAQKHHPPAPGPREIVLQEFSVSSWQKYLLLQCDDAWSYRIFGSAGYKTTLCGEGCFLTALAMASNIMEQNVSDITPADVVDSLDEEDYVPNQARVWWNSVKEKLGIQIASLSDTDPLDWLDEGNVLLAQVSHNGNEHWVLAVEWENNDYTILNPLTGFVGPLYHEYPFGVSHWRKLSKVEVTPTPPPVVLPPPGEITSFHLQKWRPEEYRALIRYCEKTQPELALLVGNAEEAQSLKDHGVKLVAYRRHEDDQKPWYALEGFDNYQAAVEDWVAGPRWAIEHNPIDIFLGLNEEIPTGNLTKLQQVIAFETALSHYCASIWGDDIAAALIGAAVGNCDHSEVSYLLPAANAAHVNGHYIHYHGYGPCHPAYWRQWTQQEGRHYHNRALESWDPVFTASGLFVKHIETENGPIGADPRMENGLWRPGAMNAAKGWKHPDCLNGNEVALLEWHQTTRGQKLAWNKDNGHRYRGGTAFTINFGEHPDNWPHFQYHERQLDAMAEVFS